MVGVQNSNLDDYYVKVSKINVVRLDVLQLNIPSMKKIIFEVIYKMLQTKRSLLTFDTEVVSKITEQIKVFGTSIAKFKRLLRELLSKHFFNSRAFFLFKDGVIPFYLKPSEKQEI